MTTEEAVNRRFTLLFVHPTGPYILIDHFYLTEGPVRYNNEAFARERIVNRLWGTPVPVDDPENKIGNSATDTAQLVRIQTV